MDPNARLTLRQDVTLDPVSEVEPETRSRFEHREGDFVVSRNRSRTASTLVNGETADLLQCFRKPHSIAEAVFLYSVPRRLDPRQTLGEALPTLDKLVRQGYLVDAEDRGAVTAVTASFQPGDAFGDLRIVRPLQVMEDVELYQVRTEAGPFAVLKALRAGVKEKVGRLDREAAVLRRLAGEGAPELLRESELDGRRYLLISWCQGVSAQVAADECRDGTAAASRRLLVLCRAIARAYAGLHRRGVLHGDVHPRNLLVDRDDTLRMVDFGASRWLPAQPDRDLGRPGIPFYFEPELARSILAGRGSCPSSASGEQFALGALLYFLVSGAYYYDFSLERREMLCQIAEQEPLPFSARGRDPWPELESLLGRALAKQPTERFESVEALAAALDEVALPSPEAVSRRSDPEPASRLRAVERRILRAAALDGPWLTEHLEPPRASLSHGAAGVALALLRISCAREDPALLALADIWGSQALREISTASGFYNEEWDLTRERVGEISPYHCASGVHATRAWIAHARGDLQARNRAVEAFIDASRATDESWDLTLGRAGTLLIAALLVDVLSGRDSRAAARLVALGRQTLRGLWQEIDGSPALDQLPGDYPGIAHGWAGQLYATLQWCRASGDEAPASLAGRLGQLADRAEPVGRGARWTATAGARLVGGWCHGSAGFVFLWTLAHRQLGDPAFLELAEAAGWTAWEEPGRLPTLCCGLVGRAYALLNLFKHTREQRWLQRARELAGRAVAAQSWEEERRYSLHRGELGLAVLAADLDRPHAAVMPFFEEEGWRDTGLPENQVGS